MTGIGNYKFQEPVAPLGLVMPIKKQRAKRQRVFLVEQRSLPSKLGDALGAKPGEWQPCDESPQLYIARIFAQVHNDQDMPKLFARGTEYRVRRTDRPFPVAGGGVHFSAGGVDYGLKT